MPTECNLDSFAFTPVDGRAVVAAFDGGAITSDAGAPLLGGTDRAIGLIDRFAGCFTDHRRADLIEHEVRTLVGQRVFGIALGYEDLIDHDELRHDPMMAVLAGKLAAKRSDCAPVAGKSTLNRLELSGPTPSLYHKIAHDGSAIENLFVTLFVEAHKRPPKQIVLDLDAIRCTGIRRVGSSTATTTATAICRSISSAAGICCAPSSGARTSTPRRDRSRRLNASWRRSARTGPKCASCSGPIRVSRAKP